MKKKRKDLTNFEFLTPKGLTVKEDIVEAMITDEFKTEKEEVDAKSQELEAQFKEKEDQIGLEKE